MALTAPAGAVEPDVVVCHGWDERRLPIRKVGRPQCRRSGHGSKIRFLTEDRRKASSSLNQNPLPIHAGPHNGHFSASPLPAEKATK